MSDKENLSLNEMSVALEDLLEESEKEAYLKAGGKSGPASPGKKNKAKLSKKELENWGRPGHLTRNELDVYVKFRDEVEKRGGEFRSTVYSFTEAEGEAYTMTRWLRARKFVYEDVVTMVEEATECRKEPRAKDFYPNPTETLGVDPSVFISQYPQLYSGYAKNGCPVFYSKPGLLSIDGVECITSTGGFLEYHWHVMQHDFCKRLLTHKEQHPEFKRFECISILDLNHLTMAQISKRTLDIIKKQSSVDSLCFPETMNRMVIVNAPTFFSMTWKVIKGWLDARTVSKIDLFSSKSAATKKLKELIDVDQIPKDYGGTAEDTNTTMAKSAAEYGGFKRMVTDLMYLRGRASFVIDLKADEELEVSVHTRGDMGGVFSIVDAKTKTSIVPATSVVHKGPTDDSARPTTVVLTEASRIQGPVSLKVKAESKATRMKTEANLVLGKIYSK